MHFMGPMIKVMYMWKLVLTVRGFFIGKKNHLAMEKVCTPLYKLLICGQLILDSKASLMPH